MYRKTPYSPTQIAVFHDYDNVRILAKQDGIPIIDLILNYINSIGYISRYYIFVSNPCYKMEIIDLHKTIVNRTNAWSERIVIVEDYSANIGADDVDYKLIKTVYQHDATFPFDRAYILVSGDGDFYPIILYLRLKNKHIKVFANPNNSNKLLREFL